MSHLFPLAMSARAAFEATRAARTRHEAERLADGVPVERLETEWLSLSHEDAGTLLALADQAMAQGFVQRYEDVDGTPVLAVSYWKLASASAPTGREAPTPTTSAPDDRAAAGAGGHADEDHTDDLYFRSKRTRPRTRRAASVDPRQMDLFSGPDAMGYERRDPDNPGIVLTEEEGDGTTFGG